MYSPHNPEVTIHQDLLVEQLNALLTSLNLSIPLISPTDLTPGLLIAVLESLLGTRIPLMETDCNYKGSRRTRASKIQDMKIFLGVLETDILKTDVGLSDLDPRRLADGEWDEVLFVAELLCWIGRKAGLIRAQTDTGNAPTAFDPTLLASSPVVEPIRRLSPKSQLDLDAESLFQTGSTLTGSTKQFQRLFSPFSKQQDESVTSVDTCRIEDDRADNTTMSDNILEALSFPSQFTESHPIPPQCIHEIPSPSLLFSMDFPTSKPSKVGHHPSPRRRKSPSPDRSRRFCECHPSLASTLPVEHDHRTNQAHVPVRNSGYIEQVDEEFELASFESNRSSSFSRSISRDKKAARLTSVHESYTRTLELLNERARLLTQLAELKNS
ncbi:hypothetical protein B0H34DRAFT_780569 [Crassisporium funariophilum]|nr:hypothetical protein B0H34DRAFT_780569 [Crassisporium funariophilum]